MANVTPPTPEPAKKRARRKPAKKKKPEPASPLNQQQLSALIVSGSAIVASRPNMAMWAITQEEADQLSKPICNMIANSEKLSAIGEHADAVSLAMACIMIFVPRLISYLASLKQTRIKSQGGVALVRTDSKKPEGARSSGKSHESSSPAVQTHADGISTVIPSTVF